jgi:hypothetical protein
MAADEKMLSALALGNELAAIYVEVTKLALKPSPPPLPRPGFALPAWCGAMVSWTLLISSLSTIFWAPDEATIRALQDPKAAAIRAIESAMKPAPSSEKLTPEEYFFNDPKTPKLRWDIPKPETAPSTRLARVKSASSEDVASVLIDGQKLLLSYQPNSVDTLIAVPVVGKDGSGFMLYDGHNRRVIGRKVLMPTELPKDKSWFEVDSMKVFYAGQPSTESTPPLVKPEEDSGKPTVPSDLPEREMRPGDYQNTP